MFHPELTEDRARGPHKSAAFVGRGGARKRNGVFAVRRKRSGADFAPTRSEGPFLFPQKKKWTLPLPGRHPPEGLRPPQGGTLPAPGGHWPPLHKGGMAHRAAAPTDGHSTRRAGKPALGVGAGNSPAYIERTANIQQAVTNIIASKTFDYGTICASEQSIICEECNKDAVIAEMKKQGAYFMSPEETDKVCKLLFKNGHAMNAKFVGRSPLRIASAAGFSVPENTTVLVGPQGGVGEGYPLSYEKLTSVLAFYVVKDWHEACELSIELLQNGIGHTMSLHTENKNIVLEFTRKPASRILVNTGSSMGGTGASTGLLPSFTLGCGTWGGSSISENLSPLHLVNVKKVAYGIKNCSTLAADDATFNHPELNNMAAQVPGTTANVAPAPCAAASCNAAAPTPAQTVSSPANSGSMSAYLSPADYQNQNQNNSGISYGVGCNSCSSNAQAPVASDQPIDTNQLNDMIEALVKAMRGE